jgi:hypothetical protein
VPSLWEIFDTTNLRYNTALGATGADSGFGPPTGFDGWIRTGDAGANFIDIPGTANCSAWMSDSDLNRGTEVLLPTVWNVSPANISPWNFAVSPCGVDNPVWCAQD